MAYIGKVPANAPLTSSDIADGIISTADLANTAVTGAKVNTDVISAQTALATAPADTDEFLVSDAGTIKRIDYSLIKGGGGMDLLNVTTLGSAASEIIVDNVFTATHNVYKFYIYNLKTSAGQTVIFQLRYGGGSGTNEGSDAYVGRNIYAYQSGISQQRNSQNTGFYLYNGWSDSGSSADYSTTTEMTLFDPFGTQTFPALYADGLIFNNGGGYNEVQNTMRGWFTSKARAKTGFRLYPASGNLNEHTKILTFGMKLS